MGRFLFIGCFAAALLFGMARFGYEGSAAQTSVPVWAQVAQVLPDTDNFYSVYMQDVNTAWVAGSTASTDRPNPGRIYQISFHGIAWVVDASYSFRTPVRSVVAISTDNVWAVGDGALIVHKDKNGWHEITGPGLEPGAQLLTLQMLGNGEEGWFGGWIGNTVPPVSGGTGLVGHIANGRVDSLFAPGPAPVISLHFTQGAGWMVGDNFIWRNPGQGWTDETAPPCPPAIFGCTQDLNGVRAISSSEAWAVGMREYSCSAPCPPIAILFHRTNGAWQDVPLFNNVQGQPQLWGTNLHAVSFSKDGFGLAVGDALMTPVGPSVPYIISYGRDVSWRRENTPAVTKGTLFAVSQADSGHALAVGEEGTVLSYGYGAGSPPPPVPTALPTAIPTALPSERVPDPHDPLVTYFAVVGHTLRGGFRDYWQAHGGLQQFGYPITEEFEEVSPTDGRTYVTQYFERARFESHPENRPPYNILLGLLGRTITEGREIETPFRRTAAQAGPGTIYFQATGHNMPPQFSTYWQTHGGLPVYGYPISEAFTEISPSDGKPYLVQYFERNRLEYHPELPEAYRVSLGLLGVQVLDQRGWLGAH